jgi:catechol 2,3-dioxygenase-like lactoylglutathione lyase family enzyme
MTRKIFSVAAALALILLLAAPLAGQPIVEVDAVGITVDDMDRALAFYQDVLGFEKLDENEVHGDAYEHLTGVFGLRLRTARLRLGGEEIELLEYLAPRGRPMPVDARSNDKSFQHIAIITGDMDKAYAHLRAHKVRHASTGPQTLPDWNPNAGGIKAFYFKDPDDNVLEILEFPAGKGDPKWPALHEKQPGKLFLGIDHTAIVIADTERSLKFYRDHLGLEVVGGAENWGPEQERLNNVFGARLRITALKAASGPGIEFLEYLAPTDGKIYPPDSRANDGWFWQTHLRAVDVDPLLEILRRADAPFYSSGLVETPDQALNLNRGFLVKDPDGHAMLLFEN